MVNPNSTLRTLAYLGTAVRTLVTSLAFSAGIVASAPVGAHAMVAFEAFPGMHRLFAYAPAEQNLLPIEEVKSRELSVQETLLQVCEARGYGEGCAKALLGMMWKESTNHAQAIGDAGKARGYFQIHYKMHKVDVSCAEDLRCSAEWSLDYLESNGYPKHVAYAVQCHNGCNAGNGYAASALRHGERLWNQTVPEHPKTIKTLASNQ